MHLGKEADAYLLMKSTLDEFYTKKYAKRYKSDKEHYDRTMHMCIRRLRDKCAQAYIKAKEMNFPEAETQKALFCYLDLQRTGWKGWKKTKTFAKKVEELKEKLENTARASTSGATTSTPSTSAGGGHPKKSGSKQAPAETASGKKKETKPYSTKPHTAKNESKAEHKPKKSSESNATKPEKEDTKKRLAEQLVKKFKKPKSISLVAAYKLRHIKRSGHFKMSLNRYRTETQSFAMSENIGDLYRRWGSDRSIFRAVLIDDPVFKQRDIFVTLDGQDAATFSKHINFVTVRMKKVHQSGEITTDEVVITPELFNQKGNHFVLRYGWKGDDDREAWLNYSIQVTWSFHGGVEITSPWMSKKSAMVSLEPPFHYRTVSIEGEGDTLRKAGVRHAVVTFTSTVAGKSLTNRVTIKNRGAAPSAIVDIPEGRNGHTTATITWYLKGGKKITSRPIPVTGDILYWDELEV